MTLPSDRKDQIIKRKGAVTIPIFGVMVIINYLQLIVRLEYVSEMFPLALIDLMPIFYVTITAH